MISIDLQQRTLERQASLGDNQAKCHLLWSRFRTGQLTSAQLELAAYLGDEDVIKTFAPTKPFEYLKEVNRHYKEQGWDACIREDSSPNYQALEWTLNLAFFGREVCVRVALVAGYQYLEILPEKEKFSKVLETVKQWVEEPSSEQSQIVFKTAENSADSFQKAWNLYLKNHNIAPYLAADAILYIATATGQWDNTFDLRQRLGGHRTSRQFNYKINNELNDRLHGLRWAIYDGSRSLVFPKEGIPSEESHCFSLERIKKIIGQELNSWILSPGARVKDPTIQRLAFSQDFCQNHDFMRAERAADKALI